MSSAKDRIRTAVEAFVNKLSDLVREAAVEEIIEALKNASGNVAVRGSAPPAKIAKAREERSIAVRKPGRPSNASVAAASVGKRRAPELLARFSEGVYIYIKAHPGQAVASIAASVGTSTRDLSLVLRKLLNEKKIMSKGKKRGTRYFPN